MGLISSAIDDKLEYRAYFKNSGWTNWVSNMTSLGAEKGGDYITALEARLVGLDAYHVSIQAQVNGTWWDLVYDGQTAGSYELPLTAYRIQILRDVPIVNLQATQNTNSTNSNCPVNIGANEIAIWTNDSDLDLEESFIMNTSYIRNDNNITYYDFTNDSNPISVSLTDSDLNTLSFASNDIAYACFGVNIASDLGFDNKEYNLSDAEYYETYYGNYIENYAYDWYWWLFDMGDVGNGFEINEVNQFVPPVS